MKHRVILITGCVTLLILIAGALYALSGEGSMERFTTIKGIYSVCKPNGYPAVCFGEKGVEGLSCVPYTGACY